MTQSCGGSDGRCSTAWTSLCEYIGTLCFNLETVIGGLIQNQALLRDKIDHYDERADEFSECSMLYLDTSTCQIVTEPNEDTIPYGSHIGGGWIQPASEIICVDVGLTSEGALAPSCTPLNSSFDPIRPRFMGEARETVIGYTLEQAESGGCTKVILHCACNVPYYTKYVGDDTLTQQSTDFDTNTYVEWPNVSITVVREGRYHIFTNLDGDNYAGNGVNISSRVRLDRADGTTATILFTEEQIIGGNWGWQNYSQEFRCFEVGDVLTMETSVIDHQGIFNNAANFDGMQMSMDLIRECF